MSSNVYEVFHKDTRPHRSIINERNFTYKILLKLIKNYVGQNKNILDIGCGAGTISLFLASKGNQVLGIDISQSAIQASKDSAKRLALKNVKFKKMDFPNQLPTEKYDVILCFEVIEHLIDDKLALVSIYNLLKPKGILLLSTPSINAPLHRLGFTKTFDIKVGHLRRYDSDQLVSLFKERGFKVISTKKTEGMIRNFLFINNYLGKLVRFIKYPISLFVEIIDNFSLALFGESDILVVATKP